MDSRSIAAIGPRPRPLAAPPKPCGVCGAATTNYCAHCRAPFCPAHLVYQWRWNCWLCEDCEWRCAEEADRG